jgi:hypothetical protein
MATDYKALDALILGAISEEPKLFAGLCEHMEIFATCKVIAEEAGTKRSPFGVEPRRVLDRRLQALRKAGTIRSTPTGWALINGAPAADQD